MRKQLAVKISKITQGILAMAGVYSTPIPGSIPAGVSRTGSNVFVGENLASSPNSQAGAVLIHALAAFVTPFNILTKKEKEGMEKLLETSTNVSLLGVLDKLNQERKGDQFAATLIKAIGAPTSHALAIVVAVALYDHWGIMSPAQKSLSIASMGIQIHKTDEGGAICDMKIVSGENTSFTVKDALDMLQQGKNPYPMVQNWDQIYRLVSVYNPKPTNEALMDFAASHNLLGKGPNDAAVMSVSKQGIEQSGSRPAPQYGVGALATPKGSSPPDGYTEVANMPQGNVIVPEANGSTAIGAVKGSLVGTQAGAAGISGDAISTYSKWDKNGKKTENKGAEGGSALVAGLTGLKSSDPYLYSAMVAFIARFCDERVTVSNPSQYIASLVGISLARIVSGKAEEAADREGVAIAQNIHANTPADFAKLQINMRALYANFGVSSRADAYQLSNQAYSEGRINDSDLVAMQEVYEIIYDENAFGMLTKLLQGAEKGLQIARMKLEFRNSMHKEKLLPEELNSLGGDVRARNRARFQQQQPVEEVTEEVVEEPAEQAPVEEVAQNASV